MNQVATANENDADPPRQEPKQLLPAVVPSIHAGFFDMQGFQLMQRIAKGFSASTLVPKIYQGQTQEAVGNCMIALNLARRIGADPLMVMQNLAIVQGRPAWSSQFLIASVNTCGRFTALRYEFFGTKGTLDWGCRAWAIEKATGEKLIGADITLDLAKKEGWLGRTGSKWGTMPQQMLMYRAGSWWTKAYAPELSMGLMTTEESQDIGAEGERREESRSFVSINGGASDELPPAKPQNIADRLDAFAAKGDEHVDPQTGEIIDTPEPAAPPVAAASAPSEASPPKAEDGADALKLNEAVQRGREARASNYKRELPKPYHYKNRADEAEAFLRGWDEEDMEMKAAETGSV
jgi:hypothetical protein